MQRKDYTVTARVAHSSIMLVDSFDTLVEAKDHAQTLANNGYGSVHIIEHVGGRREMAVFPYFSR